MAFAYHVNGRAGKKDTSACKSFFNINALLLLKKKGLHGNWDHKRIKLQSPLQRILGRYILCGGHILGRWSKGVIIRRENK